MSHNNESGVSHSPECLGQCLFQSVEYLSALSSHSLRRPSELSVPPKARDDTVNSLNNGHFGARPTVRYSGGVLYWGIIVVTFLVLANTCTCTCHVYGQCEYISICYI